MGLIPGWVFSLVLEVWEGKRNLGRKKLGCLCIVSISPPGLGLPKGSFGGAGGPGRGAEAQVRWRCRSSRPPPELRALSYLGPWIPSLIPSLLG